jgi:hypothetical protein
MDSKTPRFLTKYQIVNQEGDNVLEPYHSRQSAEYIISEYMKDCFIVEIEEEIK